VSLMLHIVNGGATEEGLKQTDLPGEMFSFRDALIDGPTPAGLSSDEWRHVRAKHLADGYEVEQVECEEGLRQQEQLLESAHEHDEVVLWFEHDLFCQVNLLYLLHWFARERSRRTHLSLINIGEFPGRPNFRGLGELSPHELTDLFPQRKEVTDAELELAAAAWDAYCAPDPTTVEGLLHSDTSAMPFLSEAMSAHLRRFPATTNGLNRIEHRCLKLVEQGANRFTTLFPKFIEAESVYGLGDAQVWLALRGMNTGSEPLLEIGNGNSEHSSWEDEMRKSTFELTETGRAVLANASDFVELNGIDRWVGGVHLENSHSVWRWDESTAQLVRG